MKTYVIYCVKGFDCVVDRKIYHPIRAMVGVVEMVGSTWKVTTIKLIKCTSNFEYQLNKPCTIYFDENGRAVSYELVNA